MTAHLFWFVCVCGGGGVNLGDALRAYVIGHAAVVRVISCTTLVPYACVAPFLQSPSQPLAISMVGENDLDAARLTTVSSCPWPCHVARGSSAAAKDCCRTERCFSLSSLTVRSARIKRRTPTLCPNVARYVCPCNCRTGAEDDVPEPQQAHAGLCCSVRNTRRDCGLSRRHPRVWAAGRNH